MIIGAAILSTMVVVGICFNCDDGELDAIVRENVRALTENESSGVWGHCQESSGECIAVCGNCGTMYYASGHAGGSYDMSGQCVICKKKVQ